MYLDSIVLKRIWEGEVPNVSVLVTIGVGKDGPRRGIDIAEGAKEDKAGWSSFLQYLKNRGLDGVGLIISDACLALVESVSAYYPGAQWQYIVHWYKHIFHLQCDAEQEDLC